MDEIERLAVQPGLRKTRTGTAVHDFVRASGGLRYYVFIVVYADEAERVLRVESIGHFVRADHPEDR